MTTQNIVILTGAGISAESGIGTFRGPDGLWENHRIEEVACPEAFSRNPQQVHRFYNQRRKQLLDKKIQPNAAHHALALLEQGTRGDFTLVTQNIDNLHERAGSQQLLHMHGELLKYRCTHCHTKASIETDMDIESHCPACGHTGTLRPDVVWFGEQPYHMELIYRKLENCQLFISIGTSGNVYPAAGFVQIARTAGASTIEFNLEPSMVEDLFEQHTYGPATQTLPEYVSRLLE